MIELGFLGKDLLVTFPLLCCYIITVSQTLFLLFSSRSVLSNTVTPWTAACQASLSFIISWSLLKLMSIELVMTSNHLVLCSSLLLLFSILPSIRVFSNNLAFHISWSKYWSFNFRISPSSEYSGLISFRMTGLISLHSKGLSRVFFSTTVQKHQFFDIQPSLWSNSNIHRCCCCCIASVVSDSVRPRRQMPTRLPSPWDSPGKSTGVGHHCLL